LNLDVFQPQTNAMFNASFDMPVLFFTQLMGLAYGYSEDEMGIGSERVSAKAALSKIGQEEPPKKKPRKKRDKQALPMPPMD
jgi:heterodisulfide reductase subunit B2